MAPRAKRRSLCEQQLDRILRAVVIGHNEPSTQNRSAAAIDPTKAMKQNVHGLVFVDGNDWLLPQLEAYAFPAGEAFPLQCFVPFQVAARLLQCDVIQLTMNMNYIVLTEIILPIRWSSMWFHLSLTHGNNHCYRHAKIFFDDIQVASGLQAAKQHTCPFCGLANKATIHRPRSYGWEAVIVLLDDFIQGRPWSSVIVRIMGCLFAWLATTSASHDATWMSLPENTGVFYLRKKLPNRTVNMSCSRRRTHMRTHSSCGVKHMEATRQSSWIRQIFWATQVRNADLLSRMETRTVLVASHAKLAKRNIHFTCSPAANALHMNTSVLHEKRRCGSMPQPGSKRNWREHIDFRVTTCTWHIWFVPTQI